MYEGSLIIWSLLSSPAFPKTKKQTRRLQEVFFFKLKDTNINRGLDFVNISGILKYPEIQKLAHLIWIILKHIFIPRQRSCRGVYWFHHVRPSVRLSVCL